MEVIPAERVLIGAVTDDPLSRITRVVVLDTQEWHSGRLNRDWENCEITHGACFTDRMKGRKYMTPEWVFGEFAVAYGFADNSIMEQAIAEFGKIEECAWARAMAASEPALKPAWKLAAP